jgi:hypothetical protein
LQLVSSASLPEPRSTSAPAPGARGADVGVRALRAPLPAERGPGAARCVASRTHERLTPGLARDPRRGGESRGADGLGSATADLGSSPATSASRPPEVQQPRREDGHNGPLLDPLPRGLRVREREDREAVVAVPGGSLHPCARLFRGEGGAAAVGDGGRRLREGGWLGGAAGHREPEEEVGRGEDEGGGGDRAEGAGDGGAEGRGGGEERSRCHLVHGT